MSRIARLIPGLALVGLCLLLSACGDDATTDGSGQGDGGVVVDAARPAANCAEDVDCDNGLLCDGEELCVDGFCRAGVPMRCDDGIDCTLDRCSETLRTCEYAAPDLDGDGHLDASCSNASGEPFGDDCDDGDPLRFPGNIETCDGDGRDDDCDPTTLGDKDSDDDGFIDALCCNGDVCGDDCDDLKPSVNPTGTEACDQFDNDCDGDVDEGVSVDVYPDADRDGHGAEVSPVKRCAGTVGYALDDDDCDDADPEVFLGQFEICDGKDNNCSGVPDEIQQDAPWFLDADQDGFGSAASTPIFSCERVSGRQLSHNDCRDDDPAIHPAAAEACDGRDNDCNGLSDFNLGVNDFEDDDSDGIADAACGAGAEDCNDLDANTGGGLDEICDRRDNDCDDKVDEQTAQTVWYLDRDGDGWGVDRGTALARCEAIPGRSSNLGDCNDAANAVHPGAVERCDGLDQNCNGVVDEDTNHLCGLDNAVSACRQGACAIVACLSGFDDCDAVTSTGCECPAGLSPLPSPPSCMNDVDCAQGGYCDGRERCVGGLCYPGTPVNCDPSPSLLQGSYQIVNSFDIQALANIQTITGDLVVQASVLQSLSGLAGLLTIGGDLIIEGNANLTSIAGLSALSAVGGRVVINDNAKLVSVDLPALVSAGEIYITDNPALLSIGGYASLLSVDGIVAIRDNTALTTLAGFGVLRTVGELSWMDNIVLATSSAFASLERVRGDVDIHADMLTSIGLPKLQRVEGQLDLDSNQSPGDDSTVSVAFPALTRVDGNVEIRERPGITSIDLGALSMVGGQLSIAVLDSLTSLVLPNLVDVGGFEVVSNQNLTSLSVPKLSKVQTDQIGYSAPYGIADGDFAVHGNDLTALVLPELTAVDGDMDFYPSYYGPDGVLLSISAPKLAMVGGGLFVTYLQALVTLDMPALTTVGTDLLLSSLDELVTPNMPALATVGGQLEIYGCITLDDLSSFSLRNAGVSQLVVSGSYLYVWYNDALCQDDVDVFVMELQNNGFTGTVNTAGQNYCG